MTRKFLLTITDEHVRNPHSLGRLYFEIAQCMGRLLPGDVGKRVYRVGEIIQVENDDQRATRHAAVIRAVLA